MMLRLAGTLAASAVMQIVVATAGAAQGSAASDSAHLHERCRFASQVLTTGNPAPHWNWAVSYIGYCPNAEQVSALLAVLPRVAATDDEGTFSKLSTLALYVPDDRLFEELLEIAQQTRYSPKIRAQALLKLGYLRDPGRVVSLEDLTSADSNGDTRCGSTRARSDSLPLWNFRPRPATFLNKLESVRQALEVDATQPELIRRVAACI